MKKYYSLEEFRSAISKFIKVDLKLYEVLHQARTHGNTNMYIYVSDFHCPAFYKFCDDDLMDIEMGLRDGKERVHVHFRYVCKTREDDIGAVYLNESEYTQAFPNGDDNWSSRSAEVAIHNILIPSTSSLAHKYMALMNSDAHSLNDLDKAMDLMKICDRVGVDNVLRLSHVLDKSHPCHSLRLACCINAWYSLHVEKKGNPRRKVIANAIELIREYMGNCKIKWSDTMVKKMSYMINYEK